MKQQILLSLILAVGAFAKNGSTWVYPVDPNDGGAADFSGLNANYGDTIDFQWTSTYPSSENDPFTMALYCGNSNIQPWNKVVPLNGTELLSLTNFDLKGWPLPLDCSATLGGALNYSHSAYFVLNSQDPNISPKTWGPTSTTTAASSSFSTPTITATLTPSITAVSPASVVNIVTVAGSAASTIPTNTAAPSPDPHSETSKGAIAAGTLGAAATIGLGLIAFAVRRRRRARTLEEGQEQIGEAKDREFFEASMYGKPEMPTDNQPNFCMRCR